MSFQINSPGWEVATQTMLDSAVLGTGDIENVRSLIFQKQFGELGHHLDDERFNSTEIIVDALVVVVEDVPQLWFKTIMVS